MEAKKPKNQICIIVEGTYPYISGGVSNWMHQIITNLPEFEFFIIVLLAKKQDLKEKKYNIPENVKEIYHIFLQEYPAKPYFFPKKLIGEKFFRQFISTLKWDDLEELIKFLVKEKNKEKILKSLLFSYQKFKIFEEIYFETKITVPFLEFFGILESLLINFANICISEPPIGKIVHTTSTGFAGFLGSMIKILHPEVRLILTEHGIYTKERDIEISGGFLPDTESTKFISNEKFNKLKELLRNTFFYIARFCYSKCDQIITLNEKNRIIQIEQGAPPEKTMVIRNGINLKKFPYRFRKRTSNPPVVGFLGRIVRIKDLKSLIRAANIVLQKLPETIFKIAGPCDEDPEYFEECKKLVEDLSIQEKIHFLGHVDAVRFLNKIDILILTSISEGQPLVIAEAASCGVPTVATDVGGCREMLYGDRDDNLGKSGIIVEQGNIEDIANGILTLIVNERLYLECSKVGRIRVEKFYNEEVLISKYRNIYLSNLYS